MLDCDVKVRGLLCGRVHVARRDGDQGRHEGSPGELQADVRQGLESGSRGLEREALQTWQETEAGLL